MKFKRFLFVVTLHLMAASALVVFLTSVMPWVQFRFSSEAATLTLQEEPVVNSPEDERRLASEHRTRGHAVKLTLGSGASLTAHALLTSEQLSQASTAQGLPVLFRKDGPDKVRVIGSLKELDSPWLWLILCVGFSLAANYARKLYARENR